MLSREKKKMCWNCGGEVPESSAQCAFCGGDFNANTQETLIHPSPSNYEASDIPQAPYNATNSYEMSANESEVPHEEILEGKEKERKSVIALSFLLPGVTLLLLGIGIFFFSEEGYFTLRWDSSYGLFVFLISAIFIYLGARNYRKL